MLVKVYGVEAVSVDLVNSQENSLRTQSFSKKVHLTQLAQHTIEHLK